MITEYYVCYGTTTAELIEAVNAAIQNGWQPLGGIAMSTRWSDNLGHGVPRGELLVQAVVRTRNPEGPAGPETVP